MTALEEDSQLLNRKIDDQYQTKIEAASKYRLRLSGIVLMNVFSNHGSVDNQDFPTWAIPAGAGLATDTFGASLRQSEIGLEAFGPRLLGAKTSGDLQVDFSGGFANGPDGVNSGLVRLRIATARMDWNNTSIVAGPGQRFYFSTIADLFRFFVGACFRIRRESLGMDSASTSGASFRSFGRPEHPAAGRPDG